MKKLASLLFVESDEKIISEVSVLLDSLYYDYDTANTGTKALEKIKTEHYDVILTEVNLEGIDGQQLLKEVHMINPDMLCIVISRPRDPKQVIELYYGYNIFAFLIKPIDIEALKKALNDAFHYICLQKKVEHFIISEKEIYQNFMDTFNWKKEITDRRIEYITQDVIHQINIGLMQGSGIGSLLSSLTLFFMKAKHDPNNSTYVIPEGLFNLIHENHRESLEMLDGLSLSQSFIMESKEYTDTIYLTELHDVLQNCINNLAPMLLIKHQKVIMGSLPRLEAEPKIIFNSEKMKFAINELLINAMKYSRENDIIYILMFIRGNFLEIKILNPAYPGKDGTFGIQGKYETLVFEPFFRMIDSADDNYKMEQVRFGLGLTIVKKIVEMHKGDIFIFNVNNNMKIEKEIDVCVALRFPIINRVEVVI